MRVNVRVDTLEIRQRSSDSTVFIDGSIKKCLRVPNECPRRLSLDSPDVPARLTTGLGSFPILLPGLGDTIAVMGSFSAFTTMQPNDS